MRQCHSHPAHVENVRRSSQRSLGILGSRYGWYRHLKEESTKKEWKKNRRTRTKLRLQGLKDLKVLVARANSTHFPGWPRLLSVFNIWTAAEWQICQYSSVHEINWNHTPKMSMDNPRQQIWRKSPGTPSNSCLEAYPKINLCRLLGKVTSSKFWLNKSPRNNVCRPPGSATPARLWRNLHPKINDCRLLGSVTPAKLWL